MENMRAESLAAIARLQAAAGQHDAARKTFARALSEAGRSAKNPPAPNPELANRPGISQDTSGAARMTLVEIGVPIATEKKTTIFPGSGSCKRWLSISRKTFRSGHPFPRVLSSR